MVIFRSDAVARSLFAVASDTAKGAPAMLILQPDTKFEAINVNLLAKAYDNDCVRVSFERWTEDGRWLYGDEKQIPTLNGTDLNRSPLRSTVHLYVFSRFFPRTL